MIVPARKTYKVATKKSIEMKRRNRVTLFADVVRPDAQALPGSSLSRTAMRKEGKR